MISPFKCEVAGFYYHKEGMETGKYLGFIKAENNPFDPTAIAIYTEEGKHIGYVPKDLKRLLRFWQTNFENLRCVINVDIYEPHKRYNANVTILPPKQVNNSSIFQDKRIYVAQRITSFNRYDVIHMVENYGGIYASRFGKNIDFVIYENEIPESISQKVETEGYHFKLLCLSEFIETLVPIENRDTRFSGKKVFFSKLYSEFENEFLTMYLLENSAQIQKSLTKKTDVFIKRGDQAASTEAKARDYGISIINVEEVIPVKFKTSEPQKEKGHASQRTTFSHIVDSSPSSNKGGCAMLIIAIISSISSLMLLL